MQDIRNTVGNIPLEWYKDYDHLGYDIHGNKVMKPKQGDEIDEFLNKMEDPNYWWELDLPSLRSLLLQFTVCGGLVCVLQLVVAQCVPQSEVV